MVVHYEHLPPLVSEALGSGSFLRQRVFFCVLATQGFDRHLLMGIRYGTHRFQGVLQDTELPQTETKDYVGASEASDVLGCQRSHLPSA